MCYDDGNLKKGAPDMDRTSLQVQFEKLKVELELIPEPLTDDKRPLMESVVVLAAQNPLDLPFLTEEIKEWIEMVAKGYFLWSLRGWW